MRSLIVLCAGFALAGCAGESEGYLAHNDKMAETQLRKDYIADIDGPDFALLKGRVDLAETFRPGVPACQGIVADGYPTPGESAALRRWIELRTAYYLGAEALRIRAAAVSEKMTPIVHRYVAITEDGRKRATALIEDLADDKLTYCSFAEANKTLTESILTEAEPLRAELVSDSR